MGLREIEWEGADWMHLTQDRDQWRGPLWTFWFHKRTLFRMAEQLWRQFDSTYGWSGNGCAHQDRWNPTGTPAIQFRSRPMRFLDFPNHEKGAPRSKSPVPLSWSLQQTVCSTFSRSGCSVVNSASLAKGGTSKKRPSPHLHKVPTRLLHELFKRPSYLRCFVFCYRVPWGVYQDKILMQTASS
jgi:hypothetical protein